MRFNETQEKSDLFLGTLCFFQDINLYGGKHKNFYFLQREKIFQLAFFTCFCIFSKIENIS